MPLFDATVGAFLGVIVGSATSIIANIINNKHALAKERDNWERQILAKSADREAERAIIEEENISNTLKEIIEKGSTIINLEISGYEAGKMSEAVEYFTAAVSRYIILMPQLIDDNKFMDSFTFMSNPSVSAQVITHKAIEAYKAKANLNTPKKDNSNRIKLAIQLSDSYREKMFIEGRKTKPIYKFEVSLDNLSEKQRIALTKIKAHITEVRQDSILLSIPSTSNSMAIWQANVDPENHNAAGVINAWVNEFEEAESRLSST